MALLTALAMCAFIVPVAVQRHQLAIAAVALVAFFAYVAVNAYLWKRWRRLPP